MKEIDVPPLEETLTKSIYWHVFFKEITDFTQHLQTFAGKTDLKNTL